MILNKELNGDILASQIDDIIFDRVELEEMGRIAMTVAPKDVEEKIYEEIKKVVK